MVCCRECKHQDECNSGSNVYKCGCRDAEYFASGMVLEPSFDCDESFECEDWEYG